jgi:2-phospho-L-lactate guanylyltransferase
VTVWIVLAVKDSRKAKGRLAAALTPAGRQELALDLCRRTLDTVARAAARHVVVVTPDPVAAEMAQGYGFPVVEDTTRSQAAAVWQGAAWVAGQGAVAVATLATDLPLLAEDDVWLLQRQAAGGQVVLAPDRLGVGTNALAVTPPLALPFCFGRDSFRRHLRHARRRRLAVRVVRTPGLAIDLDDRQDLDLVGRLGK